MAELSHFKYDLNCISTQMHIRRLQQSQSVFGILTVTQAIPANKMKLKCFHSYLVGKVSHLSKNQLNVQ